MAERTLMSEAEVLATFQAVSNWGRWGEDDERGTLNFITPAKVAAAAKLVQSGRVVSVAHDLSTVLTPKNHSPLQHFMIYRGTQPNGAADYFLIAGHGLATTHLDAVGRHFWEGRIYNGRTVSDSVRPDGLHFASLYAQGDGIVTRGVLLDIAKARDVSWLGPTETISAEDLDAAERVAGVRVESGDALFVRIGLGAREAAEGPEDPALRAGLGPDTLTWLHEREVALLGTDCPEKLPSDYPGIGLVFHIGALTCMGLVVLNSAAVEPLAAACAEEGRNEFLMTVAPLRIPKATGLPVNPLCVF